MATSTSPLGLPEFKVISIEENNDDILYNVEPIKEKIVCPECGSTNTVSNGTYIRYVRDLNFYNKRVGIKIFSSKHYCKDCSHHYVEQFDSIESKRRITIRLKERIEKDALRKTFSSIAEDYSISHQTVINVFDDFVNNLDKSRVLLAPEILGIDEAHIKNKSCATFVDINKKQIIEFIDGYKKTDIVKTLDGFKNPERIKVVTMDMCRAYKYAVEECLPDAKIVIDRFHVIQAVTNCLDGYRRNFFNPHSSVKHSLPTGLNGKAVRVALLSDAENLTGKQVDYLNSLFKEYPDFETAYRLKEELRTIYEYYSKKEDAEKAYDEWVKKVKKDCSIYLPILTTFKNWHKEIFNYFDHCYTNGIVERINGKIKEIYRNGKGYSFPVLRYKVLYGTTASKPPKFSFSKSGKTPPAGMYTTFTTSYSFIGSEKPKLVSGCGTDIDELYQIVKNGEF